MCFFRLSVSQEDIGKAIEIIAYVERELLLHCSKRAKVTFAIGKADALIRRAMLKRIDSFNRESMKLDDLKEGKKFLEDRKWHPVLFHKRLECTLNAHISPI